MMASNNTDELYANIKVFNEHVWEDRASRSAIDQWLNNFTGEYTNEEVEKAHALYLLSKFLYFGKTEIHELLRSMFQDLIRHPLSVNARASLCSKNDFDAVHDKVVSEIESTRFLGLGNPAESGTHILYHFRHINNLPVRNFITSSELFVGGSNDQNPTWIDPKITRLVFIDDFCGTGNQAINTGRNQVPFMREIAARDKISLEIWYLTLFATTTGIQALKTCGIFDRVETVSELDNTYRIFDVDSQVYADPDNSLEKDQAEAIAKYYGEKLSMTNPLGFGNSQLLLGFHHNIPNNTIPIMWQDRPEIPWRPIFRRFTRQN